MVINESGIGAVTQELYVRKLEPGDAPLLREVAVPAYSDHYLDLWYDSGKWYLDKYFSLEKLREELNDTNTLFYIPFYRGDPVGFLKVNIDAPLTGSTENSLELERIYLKKAASGKGIGRQLVQLATRIAENHCKQVVWLKAMDSSSGPIAFYEKMGFRIIGTHRLKHPLMKEELRGMVIMARQLLDQKVPVSESNI